MTSQLKMLKDLADELEDAKTDAGRAEWHFRTHRYLSFKAATSSVRKQPTEEQQAALAAVAEELGLTERVAVVNLKQAQRIANKLKAGKIAPGEARYIVEQQRFDDVASDEEPDENLQPQ